MQVRRLWRGIYVMEMEGGWRGSNGEIQVRRLFSMIDLPEHYH